jgi:hypothetical protein
MVLYIPVATHGHSSNYVINSRSLLHIVYMVSNCYARQESNRQESILKLKKKKQQQQHSTDTYTVGLIRI